MALHKAIKQDDGVTTSYHRILFVQNTINQYTSIAVLSYVDAEARNFEKSSIAAWPYRQSATYQTKYVSDMTVEDAYKFLKTLPIFENAEDI